MCVSVQGAVHGGVIHANSRGQPLAWLSPRRLSLVFTVSVRGVYTFRNNDGLFKKNIMDENLQKWHCTGDVNCNSF